MRLKKKDNTFAVGSFFHSLSLSVHPCKSISLSRYSIYVSVFHCLFDLSVYFYLCLCTSLSIQSMLVYSLSILSVNVFLLVLVYFVSVLSAYLIYVSVFSVYLIYAGVFLC